MENAGEKGLRTFEHLLSAKKALGNQWGIKRCDLCPQRAYGLMGQTNN